MATPTNHWKLGLFVVTGTGLGLVALLILGERSLHRETVSYVSYFDESVQGLDLGSPVKFRGVTIGTVSKIDVAPDRRHVRVTSDLGVSEINAMGLGNGDAKHLQIHVPQDLRIQLASAGITGVKFAQLDFFPLVSNPAPVLPFDVPPNYIPTAVSTMKNLEDSVVHAVARFPELADAALRLIDRVDHMVTEVDEANISKHALTTLVGFDQTLADLRSTISELEPGKTAAQVRTTLEQMDKAVARVNQILDTASSDKGVIASTLRATNAIGDVAVDARGLTDELSKTLRNVEQASNSILRLSNALEREPDMLLKGRSKGAN